MENKLLTDQEEIIGKAIVNAAFKIHKDLGPGLLIVELKAIEMVNPVREAQIISHLKLTGRKLGYLINFNVSLIKDGIKRLSN